MQKSDVVYLSPSEMESVKKYAKERHVESRKRGLKNRNRFGNLDKDVAKAVEIDVIGVAAEVAYCKFREIEWEPRLFSYKGPDVGLATQVRGAARRKDGRPISLILRPGDNPQHWYVLVEVDLTQSVVPCWIRGFIFGDEGMVDNWWGTMGTNGKPCWWVPQIALSQF
jgi:hypothetical protein